MVDDCKIILGIYDFEDFQEITERLGVQPDETEVKGEQRAVGQGDNVVQRPIDTNAWLLVTTFHPRKSIEDHLTLMIDRLEPIASKLKGLAEKYEVEMAIVAYVKGANPTFHLNREQMSKLADAGAGLDVDLYSLD